MKESRYRETSCGFLTQLSISLLLKNSGGSLQAEMADEFDVNQFLNLAASRSGTPSTATSNSNR
jgi:hypothetical protein